VTLVKRERCKRMDKIDDLVKGKLVLALAFLWGLAEATFFFIVPDVFLTMIGIRSVRVALKCVLASLLGAMIGGVIMYNVGIQIPVAAQTWLTHIPAISPALVDAVHAQTEANGLMAMLIGPTRGIPYKIYAVEWGARGGGLLAFVLMSIPARGIRFILTVLLSAGAGRLFSPWTRRNAISEMIMLGLAWVIFYGIYFEVMGW